MTTLESNTRLQDAFKSLAELSGPEVSHELRERIWLAVSGELPAAERRALVDRMATDAACAEAWRVAHEMWLAFQPERRAVKPRLVSAWAAPWLAAAATLAVATTIALVSVMDPQPADQFRASPGYAVTSQVPADAPLPRGEFRLRWTPAPEGSRYQLRVTTDDLEVVATATDLSVAEFVVPAAQLAVLSDGATVFWQVEVSLPAGQRVTSPTFVVQVK